MRKFYSLFFAVFVTAMVYAQAPQKMSYQAVIRNNLDELVINHTIGMKISILKDATPVFVETQTPTSNDNGLVTIEVGGGTPVTGTLEGIDWSAGTYFIKSEIDPTGGTSYTITGISKLLSVPYAFYSKTSEKANELELKLQKLSNSLLAGGLVTDVEGNVYNTVKIGTQVWMTENLKVTKYRNGDEIPNVTDMISWVGLMTGAYCLYNNDLTNENTYGALYNYYAVVDSRNICPSGWHVPTNAEWSVLEGFIGGPADNSIKLKETGTTHWISPNFGATNETGFTALPGGFRTTNFLQKGSEAYWWSSTVFDFNSGGVRWIVSNNNHFGSQNDANYYGHSVRCLKD